MLIVLGILSVGLLGLIIKFAVSPKSSRQLRMAAIIALVLIVLSIGVCVIILIRGPSKTPGDFPLPVFQGDAQPVKKNNLPAILSYVVLLLFIVGLMVYVLRTGKIGKAVQEIKADTAVFKKKNEIDKIIGDKEPDSKEPGKKEGEEDFNIDFKDAK